MKAYLAFSKKELLESFRTYKMLIMMVIFILFAVMSPAAAKLTPKIMEMALPEGVSISMGDPTALDSWQQFFKNVGQMGLFVLVIMNSGLLIREINKGTLINLLTKGLTRKTVILSKFSMAVLQWTIVYWVSEIITYYYTFLLWKDDHVKGLVGATVYLWIFGILLISIVILASTIGKSTYTPLLLIGGIVALLMFLQMIPKMNQYNPIQLATDNYSIVSGTIVTSDLYKPLVVALIAILINIVVSRIIFDKRKL